MFLAHLSLVNASMSDFGIQLVAPVSWFVTYGRSIEGIC